MKMKLSSLIVAGLFMSAAIAAFAGPPLTYETLNRPQQFQQLRSGDRIVYACNQCKTIAEQIITSATQARECCKVGADITCPVCKTTFKIVTKDSSKTGAGEIAYINAKCEESLFIARTPVHN
jgi:hypothetical protein